MRGERRAAWRSSAAGRAAVALVWLAVAAAPARATPWHVHYQRGVELAEAGRCADALPELAEAARLGPAPQARVRTYGSEFLFAYDPPFRRAACLAELGRWEAGLAALAEADAAAVTPADQRTAVRMRLERQRNAAPPPARPDATGPARAARLAVVSVPAGARVSADGWPLGTTPLAAASLPPGRHRVEVAAAGHERWREEVELEPGETLRLELSLRALPGAAAAPPAGAAPTAAAGGEQTVAPRGPAVDAGAAPGAPGVGGGSERGPVTAPDSGAGSAPPAGPTGKATVPSPRDAPGPASAAGTQTRADGDAVPRPFPVATVFLAAAALLVAAGLLARRRRAADSSRSPTGPLRRLGPYELLGELGRGGMAVTYRGRRDADGLPVAVKVPHASGDATYPERFLREGRLGERLHHPGLVEILDVGEADGTLYLVMELLGGRTLRAELDAAGGRLPLARALDVAAAVAAALDYAHGKGVVHRDLKPENVMVLPDGTVKVLDFGVARVEGQPGLTTSQVFLGSPIYAAPELVEPRNVDGRSDLYSLGVVLFEMLEGRPPFVHESVFRLLELHQREPLPAPETQPVALPPAVWRLLARLLAKAPGERFQTAEELLVELGRLRNAVTASDGIAVPSATAVAPAG